MYITLEIFPLFRNLYIYIAFSESKLRSLTKLSSQSYIKLYLFLLFSAKCCVIFMMYSLFKTAQPLSEACFCLTCYLWYFGCFCLSSRVGRQETCWKQFLNWVRLIPASVFTALLFFLLKKEKENSSVWHHLSVHFILVSFQSPSY